MLSILAQAAPVGSTTAFANEHSGVLLTVLSVVWALLLVTVGVIFNWFRAELLRLTKVGADFQEAVDEIGRRVGAVEAQLKVYDELAQARDRTLTTIATDIKDLGSGLQALALENQKAHNDIIVSRHTLIERVTRVEDKVAMLPNGKLWEKTVDLDKKLDEVLAQLGKK